MKIGEIISMSLIVLVIMAFTTSIVFTSLTGRDIFAGISLPSPSPTIELESCSNNVPIIGLSSARDEHLTKLGEFQERCESYVTNELMIFIEMPNSDIAAIKQANTLAETLFEFKLYGISPIVIIEPVTDWGLIDFEEFKSGFYSPWIDTFFITLQNLDVTEDMMGTWVPFPEANLPYWNHANATAEDFAAIVNIYLGTLKKYYPHVHGSILLNSATYESDDFNWVNGEYVSLLPYVKDINPNLIDSFGLQGFPWSPPATALGSGIYNAQEFLNHVLIKEVAEYLNISNVWLNTGTYRYKYTDDPQDIVEFTASKRKNILQGIMSEATKLKELGYDVTINVFAEDKSNTSEATDWSYGVESTQDLDHFIVFSEFVQEVNTNNMNLSLFVR